MTLSSQGILFHNDHDFSRLDYNQYTVNQTVPLQQPNVRISEVSTKQYPQKSKKVSVNDADRYNLNHDVTAQDYDIYENQVRKRD